MNPTFIGYFPKKKTMPPDSFKAHGVKEICSASCCISSAPDDWISQWKHNEMWVFDSPELAWSVVSEKDRKLYEMFAYAMFPVVFKNGKQEPYEIYPCPVLPMTESYEFLGFDTIARSQNNAFECSPLSCNGMVEKIPVNRYCLLDTTEEAFSSALRFSAGE